LASCGCIGGGGVAWRAGAGVRGSRTTGIELEPSSTGADLPPADAASAFSTGDYEPRFARLHRRRLPVRVWQPGTIGSVDYRGEQHLGHNLCEGGDRVLGRCCSVGCQRMVQMERLPTAVTESKFRGSHSGSRAGLVLGRAASGEHKAVRIRGDLTSQTCEVVSRHHLPGRRQ